VSCIHAVELSHFLATAVAVAAPAPSRRSPPRDIELECGHAEARRSHHDRTHRGLDSFDKTNVFQNESIWLAEQINESLYEAGNDGKTLKPWLATSYTKSKGRKTYTFKLRKGVKFSNGKR